MVKKIFVNGYGSIGRRIASFIADDPQVQVIGIAKYSPDGATSAAISAGLKVYVPDGDLKKFADFEIAGTIESALDQCDLVIDASPGGTGYANKKQMYEGRDIMAIYQGGESVTGDLAVSDLLFNSRANYADAIGRRHVMQGSCNVTGMGRMLEPLRGRFGADIIRFDVVLVRRWADIEQADKPIPDTVEMTADPHHGDDVRSYFGKDSPLFVRAIKVPSRQMHLHVMDIRFKGAAPEPSQIHDIFADESGVAMLWTAQGTADVRKFAESMGFSFTDTNMIHIHANMTQSIGDTVHMMYSDDQTGIVIPENHMLMQAMLFGRPYEEACVHTESVFHTSEKKQKLERHFGRV